MVALIMELIGIFQLNKKRQCVHGGNLKNGPYQCTDCGETVVFNIEVEL